MDQKTPSNQPNTTNPKRVYIAHPIGENVSLNIVRVVALCNEIHDDQTIPVVPYVVSLSYINDADPVQRRKGFELNKVYFDQKMFDEVWLCGHRISNGMKEEIRWAWENDIPVKCYHAHLEDEYQKLQGGKKQ